VIATGILRGHVRISPFPDVQIREDDVLLLEGSSDALDRVVSQASLALAGRPLAEDGEKNSEIGAIEAVIAHDSFLIGMTARELSIFHGYGVNVIAVSRPGKRTGESMGEMTLRDGDVVVLQGKRNALPGLLQELGCLPLAERQILLGTPRSAAVPLAILVAAMGATALGLAPVGIAFFAAALGMVILRAIPLSEIYRAVDGPILVMLAALIPVSDSLRTTGASDVVAAWLGYVGANLPTYGALALILVTAMLVTPFLNNAATVLVMAPIAASFAANLHYKPEAFLMAVAIGAGCDFLTPIGHQCNTLVFGPGGYRFSDYPRLGLPLSALIVLVSVPTLLVVWPLT